MKTCQRARKENLWKKKCFKWRACRKIQNKPNVIRNCKNDLQLCSSWPCEDDTSLSPFNKTFWSRPLESCSTSGKHVVSSIFICNSYTFASIYPNWHIKKNRKRADFLFMESSGFSALKAVVTPYSSSPPALSKKRHYQSQRRAVLLIHTAAARWTDGIYIRHLIIFLYLM